jgi:twitching motility protein PilT
MNIDDLLRGAVDRGASDLHLKAGSYPMMRVHGELVPVTRDRILMPDDTAALAAGLMPARERERFDSSPDVDFSYSIPGCCRFRCNVFRQRGTVALVLRVIPRGIPSFDSLLLPAVLKRIADEERGLVLVTGTSGSGKTTTLAAMVRHINETRNANIVTIEDPIEYLHPDDRSIVSQREVGLDTRSFAHALRSALRQDPDVILVGEMRDVETIATALTAAETGHLVLSTLHTLDATESVNRIISMFPPHYQQQVRVQLAGVLRAVVSQRLVPRADRAGQVAAVEVMLTTAFVRDCIVDEQRTSMIHTAIAAGQSQYGMQTFDQSIYDLYQQRLISYDEALRGASNTDELKLRVQGISAGVNGPAAGAPAPGPASDGPPEIVHFGN